MDYDALRDDIETMLQAFGSITVLRTTSGRVLNNVTGEVTSAGTTVDHVVTAVVLPLDAATGRALDSIGAKRAGARKIVMICRTHVPQEGDLLYVEAKWRSMAALNPVAPDMGPAIVYQGAVTL